MLSGNCTEALSIQANVTLSYCSAKLIKNGIAPLPCSLPALLKQYWYIKRGEGQGEGTCSILCNVRVDIRHSDLSLTRYCFERGLLGLEELPDARLAQCQHLLQLAVVERGFFAGALEFDELAGISHRHVKVHLRRHVFHVAKVQHDLLIHEADTDGGDAF